MDALSLSPILLHSSSSGSGHLNLSRSVLPSFLYHRDWKVDHGSNLMPKICIITSTSAGLEQILPWMFKVIGVTTFLLFVEGKAASPDVTRVLEAIPGVKLIFRTKELEEQQPKSVERDGVKEPFTEVKKNYDHLLKDTYFGMYKESTPGNPHYFSTRGNGKSAARIRDLLDPMVHIDGTIT